MVEGYLRDFRRRLRAFFTRVPQTTFLAIFTQTLRVFLDFRFFAMCFLLGLGHQNKRALEADGGKSASSALGLGSFESRPLQHGQNTLSKSLF